jgi:hypothetical protein
VNGQLRFMTLSFFGNVAGGGYQLVEFAPPSAVGGTITSRTNHWADVGINNGVWMGLWYDQAKERLWTTFAVDYPDAYWAGRTESLNIWKLNGDGTVASQTGRYGLQGIDQRRIYGGVTAIPQWFQTTYNVGPYGAGWGGYASRMGIGVSLGPTFYAIPDPTNYPVGDIPSTDFKTLMDHSSGTTSVDWYAAGHPTTFDRGVRNSDVINQYDNNNGVPSWGSPAPDGLGRWTWGDSNWNTGAWIDTGAKQGFITVPKFEDGRAWYEGSTLHCQRQSAEIQVFDPNMLGQVANGTRATWDTQPASRWEITSDLAPLGLNQGIGGSGPYGGPAGATYDDLTRTLYVYCEQGTNLNSYILMYKIDCHPGDANGDNAVDVIDLGILATNYDQSGKYLVNGDFNGDGNVDVIDLGILATNYDWVGPGGESVPEPGSAALIAMGALALLRRSTRK